MNNKLKILLTAIVLAMPAMSIAQTTDCVIQGKIVDPQNLIQQIFLVHNNEQEEISPKDGECIYTGKLEQPHIYPLQFKCKGNLVYSEWFYLVNGCVRFQVTTQGSVLTFKVLGPPISIDYREKLLQPVYYYNTQVNDRRQALSDARLAGNPDTAQLKIALQEAINNCFNVPQNYIKANPRSPLGLIALKMLGNGSKDTPVTVEDLDRLFNSLSDSLKASSDGLKYAEKLAKLKAGGN